MKKLDNIVNLTKEKDKIINPVQEIIQEAELITIERSDRNKDGLLLAADGKPSHYQNELYWKMIKTESFAKWFQGSVVIHKDNKEPLLIFHSTLKREIIGENLRPNEKADDWNPYGVYFSSNKKATIDFYNTQYKDDIDRFKRLSKEDSIDKDGVLSDKEEYMAENEGQVKTFGAFAKIEKPLKLEGHDELMEISWAGFNRQDLLKEYDGIIVNNDTDFSDQYIIFKEENILILPSVLD